MSDETIKLRDAEGKVVALTNENAGLRLQLKDRDATIGTLENELKTLRDDAQKRAAADEQAAITAAFETYKDAKRLSDLDKQSMLLTYRNDRALFDKLYPPIAPDKRHLLSNLSTRQSPAAQSYGVPPMAAPPAFMNQNAWSGNAPMPGMQMPMHDKRAYAEKLSTLTEEKVRKGVPREQATVEARREMNQAPPTTT